MNVELLAKNLNELGYCKHAEFLDSGLCDTIYEKVKNVLNLVDISITKEYNH